MTAVLRLYIKTSSQVILLHNSTLTIFKKKKKKGLKEV